MSPFNRVLQSATWDYFTLRLPERFSRSPKVVKGEIMTGINDLVQELTSDDSNAVGASFFAMLRLLEILQECFNILEVCFDIIFRFCDCRRLS